MYNNHNTVYFSQNLSRKLLFDSVSSKTVAVTKCTRLRVVSIVEAVRVATLSK